MTSVTRIEIQAGKGLSIPAVLVESVDGQVEFHRELLMATLARARNAGKSRADLERFVFAIAGLLQYYLAKGSPTLDEDGLQRLVWDYLAARIHGTADRGAIDPLGLYWPPNRWSTVKSDCRAIADFSDYCAAQFGYLPLMHSTRVPHKTSGNSHVELQRLKKIIERSFLGHLSLLGKGVRKSPMPGRKQLSTGGIGRLAMPVHQAWDFIEAEKNPQLRMIWLLGFWGGPRISEQLNLWRSDVLPGECRSVLFDEDPFRQTCLVVLANPWQSTYCGDLGNSNVTRSQFLMSRYGIRPRPDLKQFDGGKYRSIWAGWKGMLETNDARHVSQVFWADLEAAEEYERLHQWLLDRHRQLAGALKRETWKSHPFLHINLDTNSGSLGVPLKLSNVNKAFDRAAKRVGLTPHRGGISIHGMRHFYKHYVKSVLKMGPSEIKLFMRHSREESQQLYGGIDVAAINHALYIGQRRRQLECTNG